MLTLLRTEFRKILPYRTVWVILGIFSVLLFLIIRGSSSFMINGKQMGSTLYQFPDLWQKLTYIASYFNLLLGILIIILVTDEYSFRTLRQQIIDGYFRSDIIASKLLVVVSVAIFSTVVLTGLGLFFGLAYAQNVSVEQVYGNMMYLVYYFVQAIGYMALAMFFAFLIRKNGLAIIGYLVFALLLEPIARYPLDDELDKFFPIKVLKSLSPTPGQDLLDSAFGATVVLSPQQAVIPAVAYILLFAGLSYMLLKVRDL
jgi:ABC-2 type transport system permease protein